jgi:hypothetical protein
MSEIEAPRLRGYTKTNSHACPRCHTLARVLYRRVGNNPPEREHQAQGFTEVRFGTGTLLIGANHVDNGYAGYYGYQVNATCGYIVPSSTTSPESFIQQVYERLHYHGTRPDHRIVGFDWAAMLRQPWVLTVPAQEKGEPSLQLLPHPNLLRAIMARGGKVPKPGENVKDLDGQERVVAIENFLKAIHARTETRPF